MLPDERIGCHRLARKCRDGVVNDRCQMWISVKGVDPQSNAIVDRYGCADAFVPMLLVEIAQQSRQTSAAVESFRNEVVKANEETVQERRNALAYVGDRLKLGMK